jgi:hypothetical protein
MDWIFGPPSPVGWFCASRALAETTGHVDEGRARFFHHGAAHSRCACVEQVSRSGLENISAWPLGDVPWARGKGAEIGIAKI